MTASLGIATQANVAGTWMQLMESADFALYHAKERDRGSAVIFDETHAGNLTFRRKVEFNLRRANLDSEMSVLFQPIIDLERNEIISFETLARWSSPDLGAVPPDVFIAAAERLGLIRKLTAVLFAKACVASRLWPEHIRMSFNLSAEDLLDVEAAHRLLSIAALNGLAPTRLMFEVTETAVMYDFDQARDFLHLLREAGCHVALDDFGTGYSSLGYVHRLPLDKLKIDQSFTRSFTMESASQSILRSIFDLSQNLDLDCVVEGVETPEEVAILTTIGFRLMQGYYFSRPVSASESYDQTRRMFFNAEVKSAS